MPIRPHMWDANGTHMCPRLPPIRANARMIALRSTQQAATAPGCSVTRALSHTGHGPPLRPSDGLTRPAGPSGAAEGPWAGCCALMLPQAPAGQKWPVARPAAPCKAKPRTARCYAALHVSQLRARLVCPRWCSARGRGPRMIVARATASARRPAALQRQAAA